MLIFLILKKDLEQQNKKKAAETFIQILNAKLDFFHLVVARVPDVWDSELLGSASPDTVSSSSFSSKPILFTVSMLPRHSPSSRIYGTTGMTSRWTEVTI